MSLSEMLFMTDSEKEPFITTSKKFREELKERIKKEGEKNAKKQTTLRFR